MKRRLRKLILAVFFIARSVSIVSPISYIMKSRPILKNNSTNSANSAKQTQAEIALAGKRAAQQFNTAFNSSTGTQDALLGICHPVLQNNDAYSLDWLLEFK